MKRFVAIFSLFVITLFVNRHILLGANNLVVNKMRRVVLCNNKPFSEQVTDPNSIYVIRCNFDLKGENVTIPQNCTLEFKSRGSISNGAILFQNTTIIGGLFSSCSFEGSIITNKAISDYRFASGNINDTEVLAWLITQAVNNSVALDITRDYYINSFRRRTQEVYGEKVFLLFFQKSIVIHGNNHTIYDTFVSEAGNTTTFLALVECHDIFIDNLFFVGLHNEANNKTNYNNLGKFRAGGCVFIWMYGDTDNVTIKNGRIKYGYCYALFGCSAFVSMDAPDRVNGKDNLTVLGLTNADIQVEAFDVTYAVAINKGENIDIDVVCRYCSRSVYLGGVIDSKVKVSGCFASTPAICLLKDVISYSDTSYKTRVYTQCNNVDVSVNWLNESDTLTNYKWGDVLVIISHYNQIDSGGQYGARLTEYNVDNVRVVTSGSPDNGAAIAVIFPDIKNNEDKYNIELTGKGKPNIRWLQKPGNNITANLKIKDSEITRVQGYWPKGSSLVMTNSTASEIRNTSSDNLLVISKDQRSKISSVKGEVSVKIKPEFNEKP